MRNLLSRIDPIVFTGLLIAFMAILHFAGPTISAQVWPLTLEESHRRFEDRNDTIATWQAMDLTADYHSATALNRIADSIDELVELRRTEISAPTAKFPLDINHCTSSDLMMIEGMTWQMAKSIVVAVRVPFTSLEDLMLISGMTPELKDKIAPMLMVEGSCK